MPSRYYVRNFTPNYYYHVYNRGGRKQNIFEDENDYSTFMDIIKYYFKFPSGKPISRIQDLNSIQVRNLSSNTSSFKVVCYCLMPNHFHLLLKQDSQHMPNNSIPNFMKRITITYAMYYKDKYGSSGALFEGKYKNILIDNDSQLIYLTKYIHRNPLELSSKSELENYQYSSYKHYLDNSEGDLIESSGILSHFSSKSSKLSYKSFIEESNYKTNITHLKLEP